MAFGNKQTNNIKLTEQRSINSVRSRKIRELTRYIKSKIGGSWSPFGIRRKINKIKTRCLHPGLNASENSLCIGLLKTVSGNTQQIENLLAEIERKAEEVERKLR